MTWPCGKRKRSNVVGKAKPIRGWADEIGPLLSVSGFPSSPEMPLAFLPRLGFGPPPSAADGLQRDPPNPSERHRLGYGRPETDAGGPIMFTQPQQNAQPSIPTNLPTPLPPGPVPAPAPRQAGDIPDPPLSAAGSSKAKGGTVFDVVTDKIISLLEQGTAPWRADWVRAAKTPMSLARPKRQQI